MGGATCGSARKRLLTSKKETSEKIQKKKVNGGKKGGKKTAGPWVSCKQKAMVNDHHNRHQGSRRTSRNKNVPVAGSRTGGWVFLGGLGKNAKKKKKKKNEHSGGGFSLTPTPPLTKKHREKGQNKWGGGVPMGVKRAST